MTNTTAANAPPKVGRYFIAGSPGHASLLCCRSRQQGAAISAEVVNGAWPIRFYDGKVINDHWKDAPQTWESVKRIEILIPDFPTEGGDYNTALAVAQKQLDKARRS